MHQVYCLLTCLTCAAHLDIGPSCVWLGCITIANAHICPAVHAPACKHTDHEHFLTVNICAQVVPSSGTVLPMGNQVILVEFLSQSLQVYNDHQLALDIMTVGEGLHHIPIKAECVVPMITPSTELLDFEQCYLRSAALSSLSSHMYHCMPSKSCSDANHMSIAAHPHCSYLCWPAHSRKTT